MRKDLTELLGREPFVPFKIILTSGNAYEVISPLQVAVGESQFNYYYPRSDRWAILRQNQVASYEVLEETKK